MPKKKPTPPSHPTSLVTFLLDKSGSMWSCLGATIEAFNAYLSGLKSEKEAVIDFTFLQFDDSALEKVCVRQPISTVATLSRESYQPRGGTPLVDTAYDTIVATANAVDARGDNPKVVIVIQTDGEENASTKHTFEELSALIAEKTKLGWEFVFMGAGINAYKQGARMGVAAVNTVSYDHTDKHATIQAFMETASNTASFSAGRSLNVSYSGSQRIAAGDRFADSHLMGRAPNSGQLGADKQSHRPTPQPRAPLDLNGPAQKNKAETHLVL